MHGRSRPCCDGSPPGPAKEPPPACGSRQPGYDAMLGRAASPPELCGGHLHLLSLGFVLYYLGLWIRAKTIDQSQRAHAERRALYVGSGLPRSGSSAMRSSVTSDETATSAARRRCGPAMRRTGRRAASWARDQAVRASPAASAGLPSGALRGETSTRTACCWRPSLPRASRRSEERRARVGARERSTRPRPPR